jgi:hypothetical protein
MNNDLLDVACPENAGFKYCDDSSDQATATDANGDAVASTGNPCGQVLMMLLPRSSKETSALQTGSRY